MTEKIDNKTNFYSSLIKSSDFEPSSLEFPFSWIGHVHFAAFLINQIKPKIFVELGTHSGNSYFAFCESVLVNNLSTKCYAVDTWQGDAHAGEYNSDVYFKVNNLNDTRYKHFSTLLRMTFDVALDRFEDASIDLLHIDGLHTYEAVKHDFETWLPKLAPGAVVIFHDTQVREREFGVWQLWEELQKIYPNNLEFCHSHGLGVLQTNNVPSRFLSFLEKDSKQQQMLKNYFLSLGNAILDRAQIRLLTTERDQLIMERDQLIMERDQTRKDILAIFQSRSWRYTAILRKAWHIFQSSK